MKKPRNKIFGMTPFIVIPVLSSLLVILLTQELFFSIKPLKELELKFIDARFSNRERIDIKDSSNVIILGISQIDYDQIPNPMNVWPWPRSYFSKVINNLNEAGVKAIGIDVLMANDDKYSLDNDEELISVIRKHRNVVVAGALDIIAENQYQNGNYSVIDKSYNYRNKFIIADSSMGIVQLGSDEDGIFRRYEPFAISDIHKKVLPTFGFAVLNKYFGTENNSLAEIEESSFLQYGKEIPRYDASSMLINYYGPNGTFKYYNFTDVLDDAEFKTNDEIYYEAELNTWDDTETGLLNSGIFKNKIVLIGSNLPEDGDLHPISYGLGRRKGDNKMWGVEIHANAVQNILWNDFLYRQSTLSEVIVIIVLCFLSFLVFSIFKSRSINPILSELFNLSLLALLLFSTYNLGLYLFNEYDLVVAFISPISALAFGYLSTTIYYAMILRKQNVLIKGMFEHYVSKPLVDELLLDPEKLSLGGEKKKITTLFSDIEGFTSISENMEAEELVDFINNYLHKMTEFVLDNNGTLDKYLGDSLMAFWGAPIDVENQELKACKTALLMQAKIDELKNEWNLEVKTDFKTRIGINTDNVVVGNIGGNERFDYTVMGDGVNLASRLEGANKIYGTSVLISESTYKAVCDYVSVRIVDKVVVKGKTQPILVYELIGLKEDEKTTQRLENYNDYLQGYSAYMKGKFEVAKSHFENSISKNKSDKLSKLYLDRCEQFISNPPTDWDGISYLESK